MLKSGFISIPVLVSIVIGLVIVSGAGFSLVEYTQVSEKITQVRQLSEVESYDEATAILTNIQTSWLVASVGIKRTEVQNELQEIEARKKDQDIYEAGLKAFNEAKWTGAIKDFSAIPEGSFYYSQAQIKIEETKRKVVEDELAEEQIARGIAENIAQQEKLAKEVAQGMAKDEAQKRAVEEVARKEAEQKAESERLAKEAQQRETEIQKQLVKDEEKARILELAKTHPLVQAIVAGELRFYIEPLPLYAASNVSSEVADLEGSFLSWKPYGASIRRVYNANDADLTISWIRDYGSHTLGEAIYRAHVKVGLGQNNCNGEWSAFNASTVKKVMWHELGHSMGYGHSNNPTNIMYSTTSIRFAVDQTISEVIAGGWYYTFPLCGGGTYSYSFSTGDPYSGFDLFVLPPGQDAYEISGGSGLYYSECSAEGMTSFSDSCTVAHGAQIYIRNTSFVDAIRLNGTIIDMNETPWPDMTWDQNAFLYNDDDLTNYWNLFH